MSTVAILILTIVLRRFDGNIDKAVFIITLLSLVLPIAAGVIYSIVTIISAPYFAFILAVQYVNLVSVICPSLCIFNIVCRGKGEFRI